jgi:multicomponent Na+:H+ antiporter subunit B
MIQKQESIIIKTLSRLLVPFIQLFGLYVIMHGHSSPGGGFQGGVILGASFILIAISHGKEEAKKRFPFAMIFILPSVGVLIYGGIGVLCQMLGANFLDYGILPIDFEPRGMGMLGIEIGVGVTVMAVMVSIFRDLIMFE